MADTDVAQGHSSSSSTSSTIQEAPDEQATSNANDILEMNENLTIAKFDLINKLNEFNNLKLKLNENYLKTEQKINKQFELLRFSLQSRQTQLLEDLKLKFQEKQSFIDNYVNEFQKNIYDLNNEASNLINSVEQLDFYVENNVIKSTNNQIANEEIDLNTLIDNYGKIIITSSDSNSEDSDGSSSLRSLSPSNIDCQISGKGLVQCSVNQEASFILSFKNSRDNGLFSKSNVSFMDIYILRSDESNHPSVSSRSSSRNSTPTPTHHAQQLRSSQTNSCVCKLERLSDGLYAVKYKLDRAGIYILNILVNKNHIGQSPYRLTCTSVNKNKFDLYKRPLKSANTVMSRSNSVAATPQVSFKNTNHNNVHAVNVSNNNNINHRLKNPSKTNSMSHISNNINKVSNSSSSMSISNHNTLRSAITFSNSSSSISKLANSSANRNSMIKSNNDDSNTSFMDSSPSLVSEAFQNFTNPIIQAKKHSHTNNDNINEFMNDQKDDYLFRIGSRGRGNAEFLNPQAVCATDQYIYITDSNNQKIDVFNHIGDYKFSLGGANAFTSKIIRRPCGIVATNDGRILVVDYEYKCVNVFEEDTGKFLSRICQNKLLGPKGICINPYFDNQIIIADSKGNSVCIFDSEGKFLHRFGSLGNKNENFAGPQYCAVLSDGSIIVTDFYNHCIKVFDGSGKFKFSFGRNGSNQGQFNGPTGVATDPNDNIIVVDWGNSRIQVFDKHGIFMNFVNSEFNPLYGPQDVTVINNTIAVADSGNHCVKIFEHS